MLVSDIIVYWLKCLVTMTSLSQRQLHREYPDWSYSYRERKREVSSKWNGLSQSKTHDKLIFPSPLLFSVRGDIDIHTSQRAVCQFPRLIQICSEWSTNPSAESAVRMMVHCVWGENYTSHTHRDLPSFCTMSAHRLSSWSNFILMKGFLFPLFLSPSRICRFMNSPG